LLGSAIIKNEKIKNTEGDFASSLTGAAAGFDLDLGTKAFAVAFNVVDALGSLLIYGVNDLINVIITTFVGQLYRLIHIP